MTKWTGPSGGGYFFHRFLGAFFSIGRRFLLPREFAAGRGAIATSVDAAACDSAS